MIWFKIREFLTKHEGFTYYLIASVISGLCWWLVSIEFAILFAVIEIHRDLLKIIRKNEQQQTNK